MSEKTKWLEKSFLEKPFPAATPALSLKRGLRGGFGTSWRGRYFFSNLPDFTVWPRPGWFVLAGILAGVKGIVFLPNFYAKFFLMIIPATRGQFTSC